MRKFDGFHDPNEPEFRLPESFTSGLMALIDDLAELKLMIYCFWALNQKEGRYRYLRRRDFAGSDWLMRGLTVARPDSDAGVTLDATLRRAVQRGGLICDEVALVSEAEMLYFLNNTEGRAALDSLSSGNWTPGDADNPVEILPPRPTIFRLYEEYVGSIRGIISDELREIEAAYPLSWIEEAFAEAASRNARNLAYIRAILQTWDRKGKSRAVDRKTAQTDASQKYNTGKYAAFFDDGTGE